MVAVAGVVVVAVLESGTKSGTRKREGEEGRADRSMATRDDGDGDGGGDEG